MTATFALICVLLAAPGPDDEPPVFTLQYVERSAGHPRFSRFAGCGLVAALIILFLLAAYSVYAAAPFAAPRSAPVQPAQSGAPLDDALAPSGITLGVVAEPVVSGRIGGAPPLAAFTASESIAMPAGSFASLAAVTWQGVVNYAAPSHGRWYLAIPAGPGVRVRICGPAGCLERISTDAGPDLAQQRAGRIADLNWIDWQRISGVGLKYGGFQGTVLVLSRVKLPETDTLEGE